ncbi:ABC transporter substrate-binding protein [Ancylobacter mangrovi]|uniref:ABC transporter substrate-binding protein n=1 Tax=Ancylobacter mangrovi TaxID=2972472 RepID=A0A9X2T612_9HYPH|nr:ABC transporter substrate-binding protein [Ancylobacter mangrovi]MCS0495954.1 ABC transporter substrate-binding protein [Ancylobacter mangrovi]MCS0504628.1 ABC transporter substrate-binding protein [Ancylobacter mangrovi]
MSVRLSLTAAAALAAGLLVAGSAFAADPTCEPDKVATKYPSLAGKTVTFGADPQTPPYVVRDGADLNKLNGIAVDMAKAVMDCAGVKYKFTLGAWSGILPAVSSGQIDAMWDDLYYKPDRAKNVDYVMYMGAGTGVLVPAGNPQKIEKLDDFCGKTVAYGIGSIEEAATLKQQEVCKSEGKAAINTMPFQDLAAGLRLLESGRTDALMWDLGYIDFMAKNNSTKYSRAFSIVSGFQIGVGIGKGKEDLVKAIYDGIRVIQADGTQKKIFAKYNTDPALMIPAEIRTK